MPREVAVAEVAETAQVVQTQKKRQGQVVEVDPLTALEAPTKKNYCYRKKLQAAEVAHMKVPWAPI